jgi:hypothetical protein
MKKTITMEKIAAVKKTAWMPSSSSRRPRPSIRKKEGTWALLRVGGAPFALLPGPEVGVMFTGSSVPPP